MRQRIAVLGATGSIGEQTLEVVGLYPELFEPVILTAGRNWRRLAELARRVEPDSVVIADKTFYAPLRDALADMPVKVWAGGEDVAAAAAAGNVDVVVNALVGYAGLVPTVRAVKAGKKVALANKESLVAGGELVMGLVAEEREKARQEGRTGVAGIVPIDSEHSAILQCLAGEVAPVRRIILTASGGALRDLPLEALAGVTAEQALAHPNWKMGPKITIDSATLINKGFEVVESRWLFGLEPSKIDVLIHPQSIVHSMVEFCDGAVKAQMGTPDMRVPISYALSFPARLSLPEKFGRLSLGGAETGGGAEKSAGAGVEGLTFAEVDSTRYPALGLVRGALDAGGTMLCALNAANEVAVAAFLAGRTGFSDIVHNVERALERARQAARPTLDDYMECNTQTRKITEDIIYGSSN